MKEHHIAGQQPRFRTAGWPLRCGIVVTEILLLLLMFGCPGPVRDQDYARCQALAASLTNAYLHHPSWNISPGTFYEDGTPAGRTDTIGLGTNILVYRGFDVNGRHSFFQVVGKTNVVWYLTHGRMESFVAESDGQITGFCWSEDGTKKIVTIIRDGLVSNTYFNNGVLVRASVAKQTNACQSINEISFDSSYDWSGRGEWTMPRH